MGGAGLGNLSLLHLAVGPWAGWARGHLSAWQSRGVGRLTWGFQRVLPVNQAGVQNLLCPALAAGREHRPHLVREEGQSIRSLYKIRPVSLCAARTREQRQPGPGGGPGGRDGALCSCVAAGHTQVPTPSQPCWEGHSSQHTRAISPNERAVDQDLLGTGTLKDPSSQREPPGVRN